MNATCTTCSTTFRNVDRDEDGRGYIESTRCAAPGCESRLCKSGCEHLSFACEGCRKRFCESHKVALDGMAWCLACAIVWAEQDEPECGCRQTDVDLFDAEGCGIHDVNSPWNERLRAVTAVQQYNESGVA